MAKGTLGYKVRTITCAGCGTRRTGHLRPNQHYCSLACYRGNLRPQRKTGADVACAQCGREFYVPRHRLAEARFCSHTCVGESQRATRPHDAGIVANMRRVQQALIRSKEPTRPERALYGMLDELGVDYSPQVTFGSLFTVDAYIGSARLVVQADGDYWHGRHGVEHERVANRVRLDRSQDSYLRNRGWRVLRLWGSDLLERPDWCRAELLRHVDPALAAGQ